jgi:hypothetical protein
MFSSTHTRITAFFVLTNVFFLFFLAFFCLFKRCQKPRTRDTTKQGKFFSKYYLINCFVIPRVACTSYISSILSMHPTDCTRITGCWNLHNQGNFFIFWVCPNGWNAECIFMWVHMRFSYLSSYEIFICFIHTWVPRKICQDKNSLFNTEILLDLFANSFGICVAIINSVCLLLAWQLFRAGVGEGELIQGDGKCEKN